MMIRLAIAVVMVWPAISFGGGLGELAARIDQPTLGAQIALEGPLRFGRAVIEPGGRGTTVRVLMAGNEKCGVAVEGPETFWLVIDDPFSAPVAVRNLDRASKLSARKAGDNLQVKLEVNSAIVWWWEAPATVEGGDGSSESAALPGWAAEVLDDPVFAPPSVELIAARGLAAEGVVCALMDGGKGTFLYATDPIDTRIEELFHVEKVKSSESAHRGRHFLERLVTQPLGRMWWDRGPRPLVATHPHRDRCGE
jgi:hypothetical protein